MKRKPRLPEGNTANGPRCVVCGKTSTKRLLTMPSGIRWCEDCVIDANMQKLAQPPLSEPSHDHSPMGPGWVPADGRTTVTRQEYPNAYPTRSSSPRPIPIGGFTPESAALYEALARKIDEQRELIHAYGTRLQDVEYKLATQFATLKEQSALIKEQTETIKDLIEELSE